uniref:CBM21 domain-containing protein n=1 Tax=Gouania willdenowi TaxID=441366 RepID=A0A8C5HX48_GOUWI
MHKVGYVFSFLYLIQFKYPPLKLRSISNLCSSSCLESPSAGGLGHAADPQSAPTSLPTRLPQSTNYPQRTSLLSLPRISSPVSTLAPLPAAPGPRSCLRKCSAIRNKKRVVFADTKGLALTAVRFFIPETTYFTTSPAMGIFSNRHQHHRWRLGFTQQLQDKKNLPERLLDTHVQLGSCKLSEHSLSGRVFASHASTERSVYIRVTFDSWRSHRDIPCTFLQHQQYGGSDVDIFTFDLILPQKIDPLERAEFCVSFRPSFDSAEHWDNNKGQNYRLYFEKDEPMPRVEAGPVSADAHRLAVSQVVT